MTAFPADTLEQLFSYGTLQREAVQIATFGRRLHGRVDKLPRFAMSQVEIDDAEVVKTSGLAHHPIVARTGRLTDQVEGTVFAVTAAELAQADEYEVAAYRRDQVRLASGILAWCYVDARQPRDVCQHG